MNNNQLYYSGSGGAFRVFIAHNNKNIFIIDIKNSLSLLEREYIQKYAHLIDFKNNIHPFDMTMKSEEFICEWYNITHELIHFLEKYKINIKDIYGHSVSYEQLYLALKFIHKIRDKNSFYHLIRQSFPDYLLDNNEFLSGVSELDTKIGFHFPIIIKSSHGKGGKGNITCFSKNDLIEAKKILCSDLFAQKQENHIYDINDTVIVEPFLENCESYNLSFYCDTHGEMRDIFLSEQIIEEVFYRGNIYPTNLTQNEKMYIFKIGQQISHYLSKNLGYLGWIGLDFIKTPSNQIYVIEANPRVNSVTHAHKLAKGNSFIIQLIKFNPKNTDILFRNFYFDHLKNIGIIPYQIPKNDEMLIISINTSRKLALDKLKKFIIKMQLNIVTQPQVEKYSKSISYYLLNHV